MAEGLPPVTFGVKVTRDDGPDGHVHFDVFAGRNEHARGRAGSLVLRHDEFAAFLDRLKPERLVEAPSDGPCTWSGLDCPIHGAVRDGG
jgi:hypothetical protein